MTTRNIHLLALLLTTLAANLAWAARDPFWPIGYEPPKPAQESAKPDDTRPEPPSKPAEIPITEADWAVARKALVISGFTRSVRPDTGETRTLAMINRRMVASGDTVTLIHQGVRFLWRAENVTEGAIKLAPVKAERLAPKPDDSKPNL